MSVRASHLGNILDLHPMQFSLQLFHFSLTSCWYVILWLISLHVNVDVDVALHFTNDANLSKTQAQELVSCEKGLDANISAQAQKKREKVILSACAHACVGPFPQWHNASCACQVCFHRDIMYASCACSYVFKPI